MSGEIHEIFFFYNLQFLGNSIKSQVFSFLTCKESVGIFHMSRKILRLYEVFQHSYEFYILLELSKVLKNPLND